MNRHSSVIIVFLNVYVNMNKNVNVNIELGSLDIPFSRRIGHSSKLV